MPQMNKGGKFIFGKSLIREDLTIHLPPQALSEYMPQLREKSIFLPGAKLLAAFA